jgi:hypothetical protein
MVLVEAKVIGDAASKYENDTKSKIWRDDLSIALFPGAGTAR